MNRKGRPNPSTGRHRAAHSRSKPRVPAWLTDEARRKWNELAALLCAEGMLEKLDADLLGVYAETFVTWKRARDALATEGITVNGRKNPAASVADSAAKLLVGMAREMGLTFSARSKLDLPAPNSPGIPFRDRSKGPPPPASAQAPGKSEGAQP